MAVLSARLRAAATAWLASLDAPQRAAATAPFDAPDHRSWTYLPGPRPGLAVGGLSAGQRDLALALLDAGLSVAGARTARAVMDLDDILREMERGQVRMGWERRGREHYWMRVLGDPAGHDWAWRLNGHHLAVHLTVVGDGVAGTPQFFGANPAVVPTGPLAGRQLLAAEEALARDLLGLLDDEQLALAVVSPVAPSDIATRQDPVVDPAAVPRGVVQSDLDEPQRQGLTRLVRHYLDRAAPEIASAAWEAVVDAGVEQVGFAWAGPTVPGAGHYYALRGPTFLVEYDNTQDQANHVHTVWRDLRRDWGSDLLAAHHGSAH